MESTYAGKVEDGLVVQAIVGTADWAIEYLGGEWHDSLNKIPVPGTWDEAYGFRPLASYPSWIWNGNEWEAPIPAPSYDAYWDEPTQSWIPVA